MASVVESFRLDDKVALVANAVDSVGQQIATALREAGATVAEVSFAGPDESAAAADALVQQMIERYGRVDILVNNVSATAAHSTTPLAKNAWRDVLRASVDSPYFVTHAVGVHMIQRGQGGKILNVVPTSNWSLPGARESSILAEDTAHGAITNFTRALATMLAPHGILVNCICAAVPAAGSAPRHDAKDVKGLAVFLASPASAYITGQVITVEVGMTATTTGGELHDRL